MPASAAPLLDEEELDDDDAELLLDEVELLLDEAELLLDEVELLDEEPLEELVLVDEELLDAELELLPASESVPLPGMHAGFVEPVDGQQMSDSPLRNPFGVHTSPVWQSAS